MLSAKRSTAVKLAQVRNGSRRERTGNQRAPLPPRRIEQPPVGATRDPGHQAFPHRVLFDQSAQHLFVNAFADHCSCS
ncbi:hypothetical protein IB251_02660 [Pseudomonas sp. PDM07]|nr:hypothetical protein [Pseudomonas sp. PDM07]